MSTKEEESHGYYIVEGVHPETWYKLCDELSHLDLSFRFFGFSNKEAHIFISENLADVLRRVHHLSLDGPYARVD